MKTYEFNVTLRPVTDLGNGGYRLAISLLKDKGNHRGVLFASTPVELAEAIAHMANDAGPAPDSMHLGRDDDRGTPAWHASVEPRNGRWPAGFKAAGMDRPRIVDAVTR
jgi:hypothetical protein